MNGLIPQLIDLMQTAELSKMSGLDKKDFVLNNLQKLFDLDEDTMEVMSEIIDIIILIDKNKIKIKKYSKKLCFCF